MPTTAEMKVKVKALPKPRYWVYKPIHFTWRGASGSLSPIGISHDEYSRKTLVIGWPFTGQLILPYRYCGAYQCYRETLENEALHRLDPDEY